MQFSGDQLTALIFSGIAFLSMLIIWCALCWVLRNTTAEFKFWLPPSNLIKLLTIYVIVLSATVLGFLKIIDGNLVSTLFSGIVGYTLGTGFKKQNEDDK